MAKTVFTYDIGTTEYNIQVIMDTEGKNIHIHNSYQVKKVADMKRIIGDFMGKSFYGKMVEAGFNRSAASMLREWKAHNVLYKWNYEIERTKSVDLDQGESMWRRFCYVFLSLLYKE
jgi:hypothetical protein